MPALFTIVIPTRNRALMVIEAIRSVQAQTFDDWELIVVDNGSHDETQEVLRPLLSDKIKYVRNDSRMGPGASRNVAIEHAHPGTRFISLLDDDDRYYPDFLERTYEALKNTPPEIGFSWTGVEYFYPDTGVSEKFFWDPGYSSKDEAFFGFLQKRLIGTGYGITFKKEVFDKVGYFDESLKAVEDTDFFLRTLKYFYYVNVPETLIRITRQTTNHVNVDSLEKAEALTAIYAKHKQAIASNSRARRGFNAKISGIYYRLGLRKLGRRMLKSSLRESFDLRTLLLWIRLELL